MTGVFDRLRAWLGSVFGGGAADGDGDGAAVDAGDPAPQVVHRDDRPLETPGTMDRTAPPTASGTDSDDGQSADGPDAEDGAPSGAATPTTTPDTVTIPDAEADASTGDDPPVAAGRAGPAADDTVDHGSASGRPEADDIDGATADDQLGATTDADASADTDDAAFACSVCGTEVDDPSEPCPLCRSTDVVPVSERADDAAAPTRGGRTTVSAGDDDEAVDRLRDVTDEG